MSETIKRRPGRPRKAKRRQRIDITISDEMLAKLDAQTTSRSVFIEDLLRQHFQSELSHEIAIPLTQGMFTVIDREDADLVDFLWCADTSGHQPYALRRSGYVTIRLHRVIMERILGHELTDTEAVDHIDGDGLNNRRSNLRLASHAQNNQNRGSQRNNTSGYKGVHFSANKWGSSGGRWVAKIQVDKQFIYLGRFPDAVTAAKAYNEAALRYHGEYAVLNEIPE